MDTQTHSAPEDWDMPHAVNDTNDDHPRKKRRKYIAKAWLVWTLLSLRLLADKTVQHWMQASQDKM